MPKLDAVLPLTARDVERSEILRWSLMRHFADLGTLWVIVPDAQRASIERELAQQRVPAGDLKVLGESSIVPEFALTPTLGGWYKQQLIKLAIFEHVASPQYLTLDADIICTRSFCYQDILQDGRVPYYVIPEDLHPRWYRRTEAVLGMKAKRRGIVHNVTPAILVKDAVALLRDYFEGKPVNASVRGFKQALALTRARLGGGAYARWRVMLAAGAPWTEYALYYTFLEATLQIQHFHVEVSRPIYDIERSCWQKDAPGFENWDPAPCFEGKGPPFFVVVQSNTGLRVEQVWQKVGALLEMPPREVGAEKGVLEGA